jgi:glycosyltransferase involved in cell wall biosynthesis
MKILLSAYACEPNRGSEPAVGWNIAIQASRIHDVWVLTRSSNRTAIENELKESPAPRIHWEFLDPPRQLTFWKRGTHGLLPFYYLWQMGAYLRAHELNRQVRFELIHHVTLTQYWTPSYLVLLGTPFVWGPLGGADRTPHELLKSLAWRGRLSEKSRQLVQSVCAGDPFLRATARRTSIALASTPRTAARLRTLGCRRVENFGCLGLSAQELDTLARIPARSEGPLRLLSAGRLLGWKGFHLGIAAFARIHEKFPAAEYWIFGEGAERRNLLKLAKRLGVGSKVRFLSDVPRSRMLSLLNEYDVLVHPSFHDSGAMICNEAMAAGRPVICLDLGGPASQVTEETGFKIAAGRPEEVIQKIAEAISWLGSNPQEGRLMGAAARVRARANYSWAMKGQALATMYDEVVRPSGLVHAPLKSAVL